MISKKMLNDKDLSPKSKGVLCYLLSLPDNWQAHPRQVADALGIGKEQIYTILKELIKTGYALKKEIRNEKGRFGHVIYEFFEEKLPEEERFKEKSTVSGNPDTDNPDAGKPDPGNRALINTYSIENTCITTNIPPLIPPEIPASPDAACAAEKEVGFASKKKKVRQPEEFSSTVKFLTAQMIVAAREAHPVYRQPEDMTKFLLAVERMVEKENQDPELVLKTFKWACNDTEQRGDFKGWQAVVCNNKHKRKPSNPADIFHHHFNTIYSQMVSRPPRKFAPSSDDQAAIEKMEEMKKWAL